MKILDATTSIKGMWYQPDNDYTVFMDQRYEDIRMKKGISNGYILLRIHPDIIAKWAHLPFKNNSFDMIVFDPPHIIRNEGIKNGSITLKYGILHHQSWREVLRSAFVELFRVLRPEGTLILKWAESDINKDEVLKLAAYTPMFGSVTGNKNNTNWICFIKYPKLNTTIGE